MTSLEEEISTVLALRVQHEGRAKGVRGVASAESLLLLSCFVFVNGTTKS